MRGCVRGARDRHHERKLLPEAIPSKDALEGLTSLARQKCYCARDVLELELAGYEALGGLLECFVPAVTSNDEADKRAEKVRSLLESRGVRLDDDASDYNRIMRVVDFVSGMTDRYALAMYRRIKGISIPGRVG
jgi:dGTPase